MSMVIRRKVLRNIHQTSVVISLRFPRRNNTIAYVIAFYNYNLTCAPQHIIFIDTDISTSSENEKTRIR